MSTNTTISHFRGQTKHSTVRYWTPQQVNVRPTRKYRSERCLVAYSFVRYWTPQQVNARPAPKYRSEGCLLAYSFVRYWTPQQVNARRTEGSTVSLALFLVPPLFAQLDRRLDFHAVGVIGVESR